MITTAIEALGRGEVIGLPTDTVYSLAVDVAMPEAVGRLAALKANPAGNPVSLLVGSVEEAAGIVALDVRAWALAAAHWPGALTLIARPARPQPAWMTAVGRTVALRVPDHDVALEVVSAVGPIAVTSANRVDEAPALSDTEARSMFGESVAVYLPGRCPGGAASTVVDATGLRLTVLRQGPIVID